MLLTRQELHAIDERHAIDSSRDDDIARAVVLRGPRVGKTRRRVRAIARLAGLLAPQRAALRGLSWFDAEVALDCFPVLVDGDVMQRDVMSLRGRRVELAVWGDPRREPYVLIPPQDPVGSDAIASWVPALREAGYAVVAFARESAGQGPRTSTLLELANDLLEVGRRCGEATAVIGHSLGAMSVALALHQGLRAKRAILMSAQADPCAALQRFADRAGMGSRIGARMQALLEARIGHGLDTLQAHRIAPAIGIPVLVVHDLLDDEVPWHEGECFARHLSASRLLTTVDLGHHGVLRDPAVRRDCLRFLQGATVGDKVVSSPNLPHGFA